MNVSWAGSLALRTGKAVEETKGDRIAQAFDRVEHRNSL